MELRDYIEMGTRKAGNLTALGKILDVSQPNMSHSKAQKKPLPIDAVVKLAEYLNCDLKGLIAANELVSEKKEEKRRFWSPFVENAKAASFALALTIALVTNFVTPTQANASERGISTPNTLYYVKSVIKYLKQRHLFRSMQMFVKTLFSPLTMRIFENQPI